MKQFVLSMLPKRIASVGVAFGAPFESALEIHQSTMAKKGTTHLHRFTGFVFARWTFGLLHCIASDEIHRSGDASANGTGNHHGTPTHLVKQFAIWMLLFVAIGLMGTARAYADCECACVGGENVPLCSRATEIPPICPARICPIVPPAISPIAPPIIPPVGTTNCWMAQVYNSATYRYEFQRVCH